MGRFGINRDSYGFEIPDIYNNAASGYTFSAEYQTVYDSFIVKPAADIAQQQDIMVRALVASGWWATRDAFYITANNDRTNSALNWINPGNYDLSEINGPIAFVPYRGFTGDGINQSLRTWLNPFLGGINYVQNDCSFGVHIRTNVDEAGIDIGVRTPAARSFIQPQNAGGANIRINSGASSAAFVANSIGHFDANRVLVTHQDLWEDAIRITNGAVASAALPNAEFHLLALNNNGVPQTFSTKQLTHGHIGGGATPPQITSKVNAVNTYLTYVGA